MKIYLAISWTSKIKNSLPKVWNLPTFKWIINLLLNLASSISLFKSETSNNHLFLRLGGLLRIQFNNDKRKRESLFSIKNFHKIIPCVCLSKTASAMECILIKKNENIIKAITLVSLRKVVGKNSIKSSKLLKV